MNPDRSIPVAKSVRFDRAQRAVRWYGQRAASHLGKQGLLSASLLVALLIFGPLAIGEGPTALTARQQTLETQWRLLSKKPLPDDAKTHQLLVGLAGDPAARKLAVIEILRRNGVSIEEITYRTDSLSKESISRASMSLVMQGEYGDLTRALEAVRKEPLTSVDELALERGSIDQTRLRVAMKVSLLSEEP